MSDHTEAKKQWPGRYSLVAIILHWVIAALILFLIALGLYMDHAAIDDPTPLHDLHKSLGIVVMLLVVARIIWRVTHKPPAFPPCVPKAQHIAAASVEGLLYLFQILLPATGWLMVSAMAMPIILFGLISWPLIPLPASVMDSGSLAEIMPVVHKWLAWVFTGFIGLHIAAALYHRFIRRDKVVDRMLPSFISEKLTKR